MYFFFTTPNQLAGHERISPQKDAKNFSLSFLYIFRLELYGSTPYLIKNETVVQVSVKLGIILTCKPKCKGLFRSRRARKHHRTTQCKLPNVKPRFFPFIYHFFKFCFKFFIIQDIYYCNYKELIKKKLITIF